MTQICDKCENDMPGEYGQYCKVWNDAKVKRAKNGSIVRCDRFDNFSTEKDVQYLRRVDNVNKK